jgi:hypothetical protein
MQDAGDGKGEVQVVVSGWEEGLAWAAAAAEMLNSSGMGGGVTYYCWELRVGRGGE